MPIYPILTHMATSLTSSSPVRTNTRRTGVQQSMLARLLASENITVLHDPSAHTAAFDLKARTLILPMWKTDNRSVYDFLVGHEVGHAKHTPAEEWTASAQRIGGTSPRAQAVAKDFLNVVEDARIERAIKREFPGMRRDFVEGYRVLHNDLNIFQAQGKDLSTLSLIDRINLHFKIGVHCGEVIPFTAEEQVFVDAVAACHSWDDVVAVAETLYNTAKQDESNDASNDASDAEAGEQGEGEKSEGKRKGKKSEDGEESNETSRSRQQSDEGEEREGASDDAEGTDGDDADADADAKDGEESDGKSQDSTESQDSQDDGEGNAEAETDGDDDRIPQAPRSVEQFNKAMGDLAASNIVEDVARVGEIDPKKIIFTADEFYALARDFKSGGYYNTTDAQIAEGCAEFDALAPMIFNAVSKEQSRAVDLMVKRFEQRRAAKNFARSSSHKTGRLATRLLNKYKFSEDIFDRITIQPDQQNHGIVILLDWSGSMGSIVQQVAFQMTALVLFCRRVGIPAQVYFFTTNACKWGIEKYGAEWATRSTQAGFHDNRKFANEFTDWVFDLPQGTSLSGEYVTPHPFGLVNIYDSTMNNRQVAKTLGAFLIIASLASYKSHAVLRDSKIHQYGLRQNPILDLGYTPLDESILAMRDVVNAFRKNGNQKVTLIAMTDGDGNSLAWARESAKASDASASGKRVSSVIIDNKTGRRFEFGNNTIGSTNQVAVQMFKDATDAGFVSISLLDYPVLQRDHAVTRAIDDSGTVPAKRTNGYWSAVDAKFQELQKQYEKDAMVAIDGTVIDRHFFVRVGDPRKSATDYKEERRLQNMKNRTVAETRAFIASQKKEAANRNFLTALIDIVG